MHPSKYTRLVARADLQAVRDNGIDYEFAPAWYYIFCDPCVNTLRLCDKRFLKRGLSMGNY